jgi:hypothetical protein
MPKPTLEELRTRVHGQTIAAGDEAYETARRVYNGMIDKRPRIIVRCTDVTDVMASLEFAREHGLDLSVRGGSHSVPGFGTNDGGVVIDLAGMNGVRVDPQARTARAEGGCTWGGLYHATYGFGLATPGIIASTGIAGLTRRRTGISRALGLTRQPISADVVTADGRFVVASKKENEDSSGPCAAAEATSVSTSFEYQLHPVKDIVAGLFFFPVARARDVLEFYREYVETAPEELGMFPAFQIAPPLPFISEADHGKTFCIMVCCWAGKPDSAEKVFAPIRKVAPIVAEMVAPMPFPVLNSMFDPLLPAGLQHYWQTSPPSSPTARSGRTSSTARRFRWSTRRRTSIPSTRRATAWPPTRRRSPIAMRNSRRSSPACGRNLPTTRRTSSG